VKSMYIHTLLPLFCESIRVWSTIIADSRQAYNNIQQTGLYNHSTVNQKFNLWSLYTECWCGQMLNGHIKKQRCTKKTFSIHIWQFMRQSTLNRCVLFNEGHLHNSIYFYPLMYFVYVLFTIHSIFFIFCI